MTTESESKPYGKALVWGIISAALYAVVFINTQTVMDYFSQGGSAAASAVLVTALIVSFIHGIFSNYFVEVLGWKAAKSKGGH